MASIDPAEVEGKIFDLKMQSIEQISGIAQNEIIEMRRKTLASEFRTFVLGFAVVVAMALVAGWWIWCEHDAELVEARAKVEQMERRIGDSSLNAQELRALYRIKMRGRR